MSCLLVFGGKVPALHSRYDNFTTVHGSLKVAPAMEANLADHVWTLNKLIAD